MAQDPLDGAHFLRGMFLSGRGNKLSHRCLDDSFVTAHTTFLKESREPFANGVTVKRLAIVFNEEMFDVSGSIRRPDLRDVDLHQLLELFIHP